MRLVLVGHAVERFHLYLRLELRHGNNASCIFCEVCLSDLGKKLMFCITISYFHNAFLNPWWIKAYSNRIFYVKLCVIVWIKCSWQQNQKHRWNPGNTILKQHKYCYTISECYSVSSNLSMSILQCKIWRLITYVINIYHVIYT